MYEIIRYEFLFLMLLQTLVVTFCHTDQIWLTKSWKEIPQELPPTSGQFMSSNSEDKVSLIRKGREFTQKHILVIHV